MTEDVFLTFSYLRNGSYTQLKGYGVIEQSGIVTILDTYYPALTGTLPLDLFIETSDQDFCYEVYDTAFKVRFDGLPFGTLNLKSSASPCR